MIDGKELLKQRIIAESNKQFLLVARTEEHVGEPWDRERLDGWAKRIRESLGK